MANIGLLVQIANFNIWNKLKFIVNNFDDNITLMLHLNEVMLSKSEISNIKKEFPNTIFTYGENKGMDIYGFFLQIQYIIKNNIQLDYICKIHTKTDDIWRNDMINPLCGTKQSVLDCIAKFNQQIGMIGPKNYVRLMDHYNTPLILNLLKQWNVKNIYIDEINWKEKKNKLLELEYFDPYFYITYPYNKIMYEEEMLKDEEKIKNYAIFHWLQIGYEVFRLVQNPNLITYKAPKHLRFSAGTMFWIDAKILISFFKKYIHFESYNTFFEEGYFKNDKPTFTHSWERLFALIIYINNKDLSCI